MRRMNSRQRAVLAMLLVAAFLARVGVRVYFGEPYFWENSYSGYYDLADTIVAGKGFCLGTTCAWWPPLYPLFLAVTALGGKHYLLIVIPEALLGAGTALCAFLIARRLYGATAGLIACGVTAFYPYYVMHDTALQETGMVTFWTALSIWLLIRASRSNGNGAWFLAGLALGAIALTRASVAPVAAIALLWIVIWGARGSIRARLGNAATVVLALVVAVGPWLIRTYRLIGSAVLSSQTGRALWIGNNPETFSAYPDRSIDISTGNAFATLSPADLDELDRYADHEMQSSDWYTRRALTFIRAHPGQTLKGAFRKLAAGFSWRLNPLRGRLAQLSYSIFYVPVALLGMIGMFFERHRPEVSLIVMMFIGFACVTVVFWAHTSHRSYLDVYWIVLAAGVVQRWLINDN